MSITGGVRHLTSIETRWTVLPPPPDPQDAGWDQSWSYLFETYTPAMHSYVRALLRGMLKRPVEEADVEDIVGAYLAACIDKGWLSRDAGSIRSFRRYLKTQVFRFTCDWLDRKFAQKRRRGTPASPTLLEGVSGAEPDPAGRVFDAALVDAACEAALRSLSQASEDQAEIVRDLIRTGGEGSADLPERLGRPARQMPVLRHRARKAFAALFAEELKSTVVDMDAFGELLQSLEPHLP